jgi:hypothetical protein
MGRRLFMGSILRLDEFPGVEGPGLHVSKASRRGVGRPDNRLLPESSWANSADGPGVPPDRDAPLRGLRGVDAVPLTAGRALLISSNLRYGQPTQTMRVSAEKILAERRTGKR